MDALCARRRGGAELAKPVKLVLSRKMMFQTVGHRRAHSSACGWATTDGKLVSLQHDYIYHRSMLDAHHEDCGETTPFQYSVPNLRVTFGRAKRNVGAAADMRGPGAVPACMPSSRRSMNWPMKLKIDPVRLRVINEPKIDEGLRVPFSSRHLVECFELGAEQFGWSRRTPQVGSMQRDGLMLGWGMAGCSWIAGRFAAEASVELRDDGTASHVPPRTSAPARIRTSHNSPRIGRVSRSTKSKWRSAIRRFRKAHFPAARWRPHR